MWAVLVHPDRRHGGWDPQAFYATGTAEVSRALAEAAALGARPGRALALDFGCGVGRLSMALADHVDAVIGVDVSAPMIEQARRSRHHRPLHVRPQRRAGPVDHRQRHRRHRLLLAGAATHTGAVQRDLPGRADARPAPGRPARRPAGHPSRSTACAGASRGSRRVGRCVSPSGCCCAIPHRWRCTRCPRPSSTTWPATTAPPCSGRSDEPMYGGHWVYTRYFVVKDGSRPPTAPPRSAAR